MNDMRTIKTDGVRTNVKVYLLLPNYFKKVGVTFIVLGIVGALLVNQIFKVMDQLNELNDIILYITLAGFALITFSREKFEDERFANLRYRFIKLALVVVTGLFIFLPLITQTVNYLFFTEVDLRNSWSSSFFLIGVLFIAQILYFNIFKKQL